MSSTLALRFSPRRCAASNSHGAAGTRGGSASCIGTLEPPCCTAVAAGWGLVAVTSGSELGVPMPVCPPCIFYTAFLIEELGGFADTSVFLDGTGEGITEGFSVFWLSWRPFALDYAFSRLLVALGVTVFESL